MPELLAIARTGSAFVESMRDAWERGDAVLPIDPRLPEPAITRLLEAMRPSALIDAAGVRHTLGDAMPVEPDDALVVPTSGSTGSPKGVVHTHRSIRASAESTSTALGVDPRTDAWLCCLPLSHIAGLAVVNRALLHDMPLVVQDRFDPTAVMAAAVEGCTLTSLVPTALGRVDASLFRRIIVGGSAAPDHLPTNCVMSYGMTETGSAIVFDGRALPGVELRVVDGELQVRGDMLLRAYRDGIDPRTDDGWFPTNDAGSIDADPQVVEAVLGVAKKAALPALSLRVGNANWDQRHKIAGFEGAMYPIPPWQPTGGFTVDRALVYAFMRQESAFNPKARSVVGAMGLMQLMPSTARLVATRYIPDQGGGNPYDPATNMALGQAYIAQLLSGADDNLVRTTAGYNGGPGNVMKWDGTLNAAQDPLLYIASIPLNETRDFVQRVLANYWLYQVRLGQPTPSLDQIAAHDWPRYTSQDTVQGTRP